MKTVSDAKDALLEFEKSYGEMLSLLNMIRVESRDSEGLVQAADESLSALSDLLRSVNDRIMSTELSDESISTLRKDLGECRELTQAASKKVTSLPSWSAVVSMQRDVRESILDTPNIRPVSLIGVAPLSSVSEEDRKLYLERMSVFLERVSTLPRMFLRLFTRVLDVTDSQWDSVFDRDTLIYWPDALSAVESEAATLEAAKLLPFADSQERDAK